MKKIKTVEAASERVAKSLEWLGIISMAAATLTGITELPNFLNNRTSLARPQVAYVTQTSNINNPVLREKEDSGPHYIIYGTTRTATRSGKR